MTRTPAEALHGDTSDLAQVILYADLLQNGLQMYRAHHLWDGLLSKRSRDLSPMQRSYALLRRAQALSRFLNALERDARALLRDYETAARTAPKTPWADHALVLAGGVALDLQQDVDAAVRLWRRVLDDYPDSDRAEGVAYRIGVAYEQSRRWPESKAAFEEAKRRFPDSSLNGQIDQHLRRVESELRRPGASPPPVRPRSRGR